MNSLTNDKRTLFIEENKPFIYRVAFSICKRNLDWNNDDELSISLIAFNKACDSFNDKKGNFHTYASAVIRNSLIDYFRKKEKNIYLLYESKDSTNYLDHKSSLSQYQIHIENQARASEIMLLTSELKKFKIKFKDLVDSSPKHKDTREKLLNLSLICINDDSIIDYMNSKSLLPVKNILLLTGYKKKFIEKWRRYIIALILILSNDEYNYIKSYLSIKVGDTNEN
ncbi:RNA polymerase sigma-I factor [Clostridium sediminicola]|uniref:RNA polymerase sigma-I factor n=1 Tax=Clostridium sediminicola TaxID=3114879 RepID=UPI0031F24B2B